MERLNKFRFYYKYKNIKYKNIKTIAIFICHINTKQANSHTRVSTQKHHSYNHSITTFANPKTFPKLITELPKPANKKPNIM